ncbi:MAG: T9SS type A sorting domain-containing protein [Saprospiraceae bacterium]
MTIEDCHFKNNSSERSALHLVGHADAKVIGTEFTDNHASEWGGAANSGNSNCTFLDCTFTNNIAGSSIGGAVFIWQNAGTQYPNPDVVFERCTFTGNQSSNSSGGALTVNNFIPGTKVSVDSCEFQGNSAPNVSALYLNFQNGQNCTAQVTNSTFTENTCTDDLAAVAIWTTSPSSANVLVENCVFENNTSAYSGALDIGGAPDTGPDTFVVRNCRMLNNVATTSGGGLTLWSDARSSIAFEIEDCQLIGNSAGETGGAVWLLSSSDNSHAVMRRCEVRDNASPIGGTFGTSQFGLFEAGLPDGSTFLLENSLVTGNTGAGVVMLDMYPGFKMLNTTQADNEAAGILLDELGGVEMQNTILHNPGYDEYIAITNDVTVTSLGGNLIGDNSLATHALTYDQQNADPLFMGTDDYHLSATSPAIDAGVDLGNLPPTDLDGNDRPNGCVDIGAYESDVIVSMDCITSTDEATVVELVLSPNPANDLLYLQLPETMSKPNEISLFDAQGRLVERRTFTPGQAVQVGHLPSGFYTLKLVDGAQVYIGRFVKQ